MSTSRKQTRTQHLPGQQPGKAAPLRQEGLPDFERVVDSGEITPDVAEHLVPQLGNEAVLALLARSGATDMAGMGEAQEEEEVVEHDEDLIEIEEEVGEKELEVTALFSGGGGSAGGGDGVGNPWDVGRLFGGEDDPDSSVSGAAGPGMGAPATAPGSEPLPQTRDDSDALPEDAFDRVDGALGPTPELDPAKRQGDSCYQAVEAGLLQREAIGRKVLTPEALIDRTGHLDPIGRPAAIGRFLAQSATSLDARVLARVLAGPASAVLPEASGHAGAAARLAALAVAVEATEGAWEHTDRCVALSLVRDAWPDAVIAARVAAQQQRLVAPAILAQALGSPASPDRRRPSTDVPHPSVSTIRLGAAALERVIPEAHVPTIPPVITATPPTPASEDPDLAAADAALARFTGGTSPADLPPDPVLRLDSIRPLLDAATRLINAMGRAQVEFAAAALAIERIRPGSQVNQTLKHADRALRNLARSVVQNGDRLHRAKGTPMIVVGTIPEDIHANLSASAEALRSLRSWAMSSLAQGMAR